MSDSRLPTERPAGWALPLSVSTGAGIGLIFGILLDQLVMGMLLGAAIGLVIAATATSAMATPEQRRGRIIATALGLVAAGVVAVVWIVMR